MSPIDLSSVESATILTEAVIDRLPVNRSITDAPAAPGTTKGDLTSATRPRSAVRPYENAYYLNGFNITNFRNVWAAARCRSSSTASSAKTGGYGAEFGCSRLAA